MRSQSFSQFFKRHSLLCEGGNVHFLDKSGKEVAADKISLQKIPRKELVTKLLGVFNALNNIYQKKYGHKIWTVQQDIDSGHIFNGSSEFLFDANISDEEFVEYKKEVGDIDVSVPQERKENLFQLLLSLKETDIAPDAFYIGAKQTAEKASGEAPNLGEGRQINCLVRLFGTVNVQIDFEFLEYSSERPSAFAKFSHSSDWSDIKANIKGVMHKYLLKTLAGESSRLGEDQAALITPKTGKPKKFPQKGITTRKFSVDRGLRSNAYEQVKDEHGDPLILDGKLVYKEVETSKSVYITDPLDIGAALFGSKFRESTDKSTLMKELNSFIGLIKLSREYQSQATHQRIIKDFFKRLFGPGEQGFERNNPGKDYDVKRAGFEKLVQEYGIESDIKFPNTLDELKANNPDNPRLKMVLDYYENYRMTEMGS